MADLTLTVQPLWWQFRDLPYQDRLEIFDDALLHRQRLEAMDWLPVIEPLDTYQIRVWEELAL